MQQEHLKNYLPTAGSLAAVKVKLTDGGHRLQSISDGVEAITTALAELDAVALTNLIGDGETNYNYQMTRGHAGGWASAVLFRYGYMPFLEVRAPGNDRELVRCVLQVLESNDPFAEKLDAGRPDQEPGTILIALWGEQ